MINNFIISDISILILVPSIIFLYFSIICIYKFITDGADLRTIFVVEFGFMLAVYLLSILSFFIIKQTDFFSMIFSKMYPTVTLFFLIECRLVGYKTLYTNKLLKSILYVISFIVFITIIIYEITILHVSSIAPEIIVSNDILIQINKLADYFSYDRLLFEDLTNKAKILVLIKILSYIAATSAILWLDSKEKVKNTKNNRIGILVFLAILILCEAISNNAIQYMIVDKYGELTLIIVNSIFFIAYTIAPIICMLNECKSILYYTKSDENWKETRIRELLIESKQYRSYIKYPKKFAAQIQDLADIIRPDYKINPDYFDKLSTIQIKKKDEKFWRELTLQILKELKKPK